MNNSQFLQSPEIAWLEWHDRTISVHDWSGHRDDTLGLSFPSAMDDPDTYAHVGQYLESLGYALSKYSIWTGVQHLEPREFPPFKVLGFVDPRGLRPSDG